MSLDAIGIVSQNLKASVQFYELLGVELKEAGGPDHLEGLTPSGVRIMVDSSTLMKQINPDWKPPQGTGMILCFKQSSPEAVNVLFESLTSAGFKSVKDPWDAFWGQRYSSIQDPDGNQIDLFAALEN